MENHQTESKPADAEQPSPEGLSSSALFAALARQYTEIKLCHDDEDGFFIQRESGYRVDGWVAMDTDTTAKRETVEEALIAAVEWHNADLKRSYEWRKRIPLSANIG